RQLAWQEIEFYAFFHFNMNTFTNMEWGLGDETPESFNPTELDCKQWARVCKENGLKGIILTAKHHDGFCLWPSAYTEHSVKNSPWKDGKGDVIRELSEACMEYGLKMGIYLSPWDRNHPDYGKPEYITYFRNQLTELLTNYGEIFEVWFDGANGGTGYYGGANEDRRVDKLTYYDWENTYKIIRELQPDAVIFSDAGPDVRWVGNEHGFAYSTTWSNLMRDSVYGGMPDYNTKYSMGQEEGTHWVPAEADVSIRPGWYYHPEQDDKVKSLDALLDIYYNSIGQNSSLLLNFPVDTRGIIHENDVRQLKKLTDKIKEDLSNNLALGKKVITSNHRGKDYKGSLVVDGNSETYWATEDEIIESSLTIEFDSLTTFNRFLVQEYIPLGQRVKTFSVEAKTEEGWKEIASETTIGFKRILRLPDTNAEAVRFNINSAKACPAISNIEIYYAQDH
ncbi:MAG: alpha-L-fucosidase, partial [Bacteroidetes bacterium]